MNQMNLSALRVTVCFEFAGVEDAESDAVSETLELLAEDIELTRRTYDADAAWIDDVSIVAGGHEVEARQTDSQTVKALLAALEDFCAAYAPADGGPLVWAALNDAHANARAAIAKATGGAP